jgi:hypothetical protein
MEVDTMLPFFKSTAYRPLGRIGAIVVAAAALTFAGWCDGALAKTADRAAAKQRTFASPDEAVKALIAATKAEDLNEVLAILGPGGKSLVHSGDPVADRAGRERFVQLCGENTQLNNKEGDAGAVLEVGKNCWPFPIPIVMKRGVWLFEIGKGHQEMLNRRIGRNELSTIQVCLAYVDAQREYADIIREIDGRRKYAQKFASDPDQKNGLYWKAKEGEPESPLGSFVANARKEGYGKKAGHNPTPYHGYFLKILKAQGRNAPGGSYDYVVDGNMIGGFGLVAYPAVYGSSGIMTFIVNQDGFVYEKNLGKNTHAIAQRMLSFDPDKTWRKVDDKHLAPPSKDN